MPFLCHFKGRPYSNVEHHRETPVEEDIKPFVCNKCNFIASNLLELDAHRSTCGIEYKCESCPEIFYNLNLLELHKISHAEIVKYDLVFNSNGGFHMETTPLDQRVANPIKMEYQDLHDVKVEPREEVEVKQEPCNVTCDVKIKTEDKSFKEFDAMMKRFKKERRYKEESADSCTRYYKKSKVKLLKNVQWKNVKEYQKFQDIKMEYDSAEDPEYENELRKEAIARKRARKKLRKMIKQAAENSAVQVNKREKRKKMKRDKSKKKKVTETDDAVESFQGTSNDKKSSKRNKTSMTNSDSGTQQATSKTCKTNNNNIVFENGLYLCEFCDYSNKKIHSVKIHRMVHTVEKPFWCDLCPKTFRQNSHLQNHRARHSKTQKNYCLG